MKNLKSKLIITLGCFIIGGSYFGVFNYGSYGQQKNFLQNVKKEYKNEVAKDRMEIYKNLPFTSKLTNFGAYLAAKEVYNQTNKK